MNDHPDFEKRFEGQGPILPDLEWMKSYFAMAGTVHDAAVAVWGVKGWYDYLRPISAIRYMSDIGQSTSDTLPRYHPAGIPLYPGYIELVTDTLDPLVELEIDSMFVDTTWIDSVNFTLNFDYDTTYLNINKIKLNAWRGPAFIGDPDSTVAGVGWILADNWWPYQRPTFVTPPFAGYVSGHSTFSRASAELMTLLTGDEFFPGGMGEFQAPMNEFLVFEDGPSMDITLQWATYRDASDQCSLSRIWGGIHPPADDIPGRLMGMVLGPDAFNLAKEYFEGSSIITGISDESGIGMYPNPTTSWTQFSSEDHPIDMIVVYDAGGREVASVSPKTLNYTLDCSDFETGVYIVRVISGETHSVEKLIKK